MFTRNEAARLKEEFWTTFGRYMSPILSAEDTKVNWVNYHTSVKDVHFRMNTSQKSCAIFISIEHRDPDIQSLYFQQFEVFKDLLHTTLGEQWAWQQHEPVGDGKVISRIYKDLAGVSVFNKDHWPDLITFFKPRIIALDSFWENAKYSFESLH